MSSYDIFATYYDNLTKNVDYTGRVDYLLSILERCNHNAGITLDLACGTGSTTIELYKRGVDVYGIDASSAMLTAAMDKAYDEGVELLFLCQNMENLDLYGTVNTVFCCLDSINHLKNFEIMQKAFDRVSLFLEPNGYFIFDFNTEYKHKEILANNIFIYDTPEVYCVWRNNYRKNLNRVDINLDFFENRDGLYEKSSEHFYEITCSQNNLIEMLENSGFIDIEIFEDMCFDKPSDKTEKITVVAKKK